MAGSTPGSALPTRGARRRRNKPEPLPPLARRAASATLVGTFVEYYDLLLYSALTAFMAPQLFPAESRAAAISSGLAVLGVAYVAKPIGGIVAGRIGDRRGRRSALLWTITTMGLCTGAIGLLPTFQ